jgi:crotonobetainyl-CoA:carnitine CoA-transferase CaiB-like acyl-CoA transferase
MLHDKRLVKNEEQIEEMKEKIPDWVKKLERPETPVLIPKFGPLQGIRVVSSGIHIAQPWTGTQMATFGAEVIHVERPGGDVYRLMPPLLYRGKRENSCSFSEMAKNRLSLGLNVRKPKGLEIMMALWKISDVWMESSAPGTCERAGLTNELAFACNPRLVILHVSTYGQYGAEGYLGRPGYDLMAQAMGGLMSVTGDPCGPPQRSQTFTGDYLTAYCGYAAVLAALFYARETGQGQVIDSAQYEAVAQTQEMQLPYWTGEGKLLGLRGNKAGFQPYDTFKCKDGWVVIGAIAGSIYPRVPKFLGLDPEEYSYEECSKDYDAIQSEKGQTLDRKLREYCLSHTREEVEKALNEAKIGCVRVFDAKEQTEDPHYKAREMTVPVVDRMSGVPISVYGVTPKMSLTPGRIWRAAPAAGEDTTDILTKVLGLSREDVKGLFNDKAVHQTEPMTKPVVERLN